MEAIKKVRMINQEEITAGVYYIKINRLSDFTPGQLLALSDQPGGPVRYYSIASGRSDDFWGILYNEVDDGWLTPWLKGLKKGDSLYTSFPFGQFLPIHAPMVWIATGTGIAPFHSMAQSGLGRDSILIHGAREKKDFYFFDFFRKELNSRYIPCASQTEEQGFYPGRLSLYLQREFPFPLSSYYICGSSAMVVDIRDLLLVKGVKFSNIISEIYF